MRMSQRIWWFDYIFDPGHHMTARRLALFIVLAALSLVATPVLAQEIGVVAGRVVDARSGAGLEKVLVMVEGGGPSTQTDSAGGFRLTGVAAGSRRLYHLGGRLHPRAA